MDQYEIVVNNSKVYSNGSIWASVNYGPVKIINRIKVNNKYRYMVQFDDRTLKHFESSSIKSGKMCNPNKQRVTGKPPKRPKDCIDIKDHLSNQRKDQINKIQAHISDNRGMWINGPYEGVKSLLSIQCKQGHTWTTKASNMLTGRWCPKCGKSNSAKIKSDKAHVKRVCDQVQYLTSNQRVKDLKLIQIKKMIRAIKKRIPRTYNRKPLSKDQQERYRKASNDKAYRKYHSDVGHRMNERLKSQFRKCMIKDRPMGKYYELLGFTTEDLKKHIEDGFKDGMSWDNIGQWHIDHIRPKSWYSLVNDDGTVNEEEVKKCWSLANLQPLWAKDNISKSNRYEG